MSAQVAAVLREARALIEDESHWIKEKLSHAGSYCAIGAVRAARHKKPALTGARWYAAEALGKQVPFNPSLGWRPTAWEFNDDPRTTHADVLALFDRAIAAEEASA